MDFVDKINVCFAARALSRVKGFVTAALKKSKFWAADYDCRVFLMDPDFRCRNQLLPMPGLLFQQSRLKISRYRRHKSFA